MNGIASVLATIRWASARSTFGALAMGKMDASPLREMWAEIGGALDSWQEVEFHLSRVFLALTASRYKARAAGAAYHSVLSFRAKLDMTLAAASVSLSKRRFAEWETIHKRLARKNKKRNDLAHFTLVQDVDDTARPFTDSYTLHPNLLDPAKRAGGKIPVVLTVTDIRNRVAGFRKAAHEVAKFADALQTRRQPKRQKPKASPPQSSSTG